MSAFTSDKRNEWTYRSRGARPSTSLRPNRAIHGARISSRVLSAVSASSTAPFAPVAPW